MDNSFGTRNFKWTYWVPEPGDGLPILLALAERFPLWNLVQKHLKLLKSHVDGLLRRRTIIRQARKRVSITPQAYFNDRKILKHSSLEQIGGMTARSVLPRKRNVG